LLYPSQNYGNLKPFFILAGLVLGPDLGVCDRTYKYEIVKDALPHCFNVFILLTLTLFSRRRFLFLYRDGHGHADF
jgi:hypothetical protein